MKKEFESEKYILLYGLGEARKHYRTNKTSFSEKVKAQEDYNEDVLSSYIDTYNETIIELFANRSSELYRKEIYERFMEKWNAGVYSPMRKMFLWEKYREAMKTKEKFMLENIFPHSKFAPGTKYSWYSTELREPFIKRGCKIGIEAVKRSDNVEIWFLLDGLDIEQVVKKSREGITNSELRYIYRNWKELEQKVVFLYKDQRVPAPWVKEPKLWQIYERKLNSKNENGNSKKLKDLVKVEEKRLDSNLVKEQRKTEGKSHSFSSIGNLKKRFASQRLNNQTSKNEAGNTKSFKHLDKMKEKVLTSPLAKKQRKKEDKSCLSSIIGNLRKRFASQRIDNLNETKKAKISHSR